MSYRKKKCYFGHSEIAKKTQSIQYPGFPVLIKINLVQLEQLARQFQQDLEVQILLEISIERIDEQ